MATIPVADFKVGDRVVMDVVRGDSCDESGIHEGGRVVTKTGTVRSVTAFAGYKIADMMVVFDDGDLQSAPAVAYETDGYGAYPVRAIRRAEIAINERR